MASAVKFNPAGFISLYSSAAVGAVIMAGIVLPSAFASSESLSSDSLKVTRPFLQDLNGEKLDVVNPGQQVLVVHSITNNLYPEPKPLVALVEVLDQDGITQHLVWQSADIPPNDSVTIGISWLAPEDAPSGHSYSLRAFAVTRIGDGAEPLSAVSSSEILVAS